MSSRRATRVAVGLWCATFAVGATTAFLLGLAEIEDADPVWQWTLGALALVAAVVFSGVGVLIVSRRPENPIGWIFCVAPLIAVLANLGDGWAHFAHGRDLPGVAWAAMLEPGLWAVVVGLVAIYGFLLFPEDGCRPRAGAGSPWRAVR
jgi:hypothetical protein